MTVGNGRTSAQSLTEIPHNDLLKEFKQNKPKQKQPTHIVYKVVENDNLTIIGKKYKVTVQRLYDKNTTIKDVNRISVGQKIVVPFKDEKLKHRKLATLSQQNVQVQPNSPTQGTSSGKLTGSIGYAVCGGNCVNEPGVNNPFDGTNPISWAVLTQTPTIGATALWTYNHTGVVTGIWSNGDIEVRHQNFCGGQHRFPASSFRGYR